MFQQLASEADQSVVSLFGISDMPVEWQTPKDSSHGDLTTIVALRIAKAKNLNPKEVAQQLADALSKNTSVQKAEVAGAGYVNVWLKPAALLKELEVTEHECHPHAVDAKTHPVVIDYSQPNIAKPLGIHHILSTIIGQSLGNLYEHAGTPVVRWNYMGDWGTQFGKLAVAFEKWGTKSAKDSSMDELLELYVRFHQEVEKDPTLEDAGREAFRKLEAGDESLRTFWMDVVHVTKASLGDIYKKLHVHFDLDTGESYYEDKMMPVIEEGKKKGVFHTGEKDALIAEFPEESKMPPAIVLKGDGATIYMTRDLAALKDRIERFHPHSILYVVDIAQALYFKQLFAIGGQLEWDLPELEHVFFGRMRFSDKSMSTRKGNILKLEHVLDEAVARATEIIKERGETIQTDSPEELAEMMGVGALVYGILSQNRKMDLVFDWDKMLSFEGNSAPYLQYTHARAKSVLRKADWDIGHQSPVIGVDELTTSERVLVGTLLQFSSVLESARSEHLPHKLANFLYQLCQDFNSFYNSENILQSESPVREMRLFLVSLTATVLKTGAELLTLRVPDRM